MKASFNPFTLFGLLAKEEEKESYPNEFALIELNPVAKSKGITDDFNKIIKIYKNGEIIQEMPYSKHTINSIKEVDEIPIYEEKYNQEEEFEFDSFEDISLAKFKTKK